MNVRDANTFDDKMAAVRAQHGQAPAASPAHSSIGAKADAARQKAVADASQFRAAILALPEAKERPRGAARLVELYSVKSLSLDRASTILGGLPLETGNAAAPTSNHAPSAKAGIHIEHTMQRRIELMVAGLSQKGQHDPQAREEAKKLNYALSIKRESPSTSIFVAMKAAGFDGKRISEIYDGARS